MGNSRSNIPFSGNFICEDLLPVEIWMQVLYWITNIGDILNLRRTCNTFRKLTTGDVTQETKEFTWLKSKSTQEYFGLKLQKSFPFLLKGNIKLILNDEILAINYLMDCIIGRYGCKLICKDLFQSYLYISLENVVDGSSPFGLCQTITLHKSKRNVLLSKKVIDKLSELSSSKLVISCDGMGDLLLASSVASTIKLRGDQCVLHLIYAILFGSIRVYGQKTSCIGQTIKEITCARADFRKMATLYKQFIMTLSNDISHGKRRMELLGEGQAGGNPNMSEKIKE